MADRETGTVKVSSPASAHPLIAKLTRRQKWNDKGFGFIERDSMGDR